MLKAGAKPITCGWPKPEAHGVTAWTANPNFPKMLDAPNDVGDALMPTGALLTGVNESQRETGYASTTGRKTSYTAIRWAKAAISQPKALALSPDANARTTRTDIAITTDTAQKNMATRSHKAPENTRDGIGWKFPATQECTNESFTTKAPRLNISAWIATAQQKNGLTKAAHPMSIGV